VRLILARDDSGLSVVNQIDELKSRVNVDGGFGDLGNFSSTVLDTAFALEALNSSGYGNVQAAHSSVGFLLKTQKPDGGWAIGVNDDSVYVTALAVLALSPHKSSFSEVPVALNAARNFLLSKRDEIGLWGEDYTSAVALIALLSDGAEASLFQSSVGALTNKQAVNGSWSDDVYIRALVLRALAAYNAANSGISGTQTGAVLGHIEDNQDHSALAGAMITLTGAESRTTVSDANGNFEWSSLPPGGYTIQIDKTGYHSANGVLTVAAGASVALKQALIKADVFLDTAPGNIFGKIIDGESGETLSGAHIEMVNGTTVLTGSDDSFVFNALARGSYQALLSADGYQSQSISFVFSPRSNGDLGLLRGKRRLNFASFQKKSV
jgi:hypothetical protein